MEEKSFCLDKAATSATATARVRTLEAWPERADEGGGPTPGRLGGEQRVEKSQLDPQLQTEETRDAVGQRHRLDSRHLLARGVDLFGGLAPAIGDDRVEHLSEGGVFLQDGPERLFVDLDRGDLAQRPHGRRSRLAGQEADLAE